MSSYSTETFSQLLKRYEEKGFINPESALEINISDLIQKGRTREEAIQELLSSATPWIYSSTAPLKETPKERAIEPDTAIMRQIAELQQKIDSITGHYSKGEITEETYLRGVKKIEEDIHRLQRVYNIPTGRRSERSPTSARAIERTRNVDEVELTDGRAYGRPTSLWYLIPFFFGIIGGLVAYVGVKDEDSEMANNLLFFGIIWTVVLGILSWILFMSMI
jgi:hypothetical protein